MKRVPTLPLITEPVRLVAAQAGIEPTTAPISAENSTN